MIINFLTVNFYKVYHFILAEFELANFIGNRIFDYFRGCFVSTVDLNRLFGVPNKSYFNHNITRYIFYINSTLRAQKDIFGLYLFVDKIP